MSLHQQFSKWLEIKYFDYFMLIRDYFISLKLEIDFAKLKQISCGGTCPEIPQLPCSPTPGPVLTHASGGGMGRCTSQRKETVLGIPWLLRHSVSAWSAGWCRSPARRCRIVWELGNSWLTCLFPGPCTESQATLEAWVSTNPSMEAQGTWGFPGSYAVLHLLARTCGDTLTWRHASVQILAQGSMGAGES